MRAAVAFLHTGQVSDQVDLEITGRVDVEEVVVCLVGSSHQIAGCGHAAVGDHPCTLQAYRRAVAPHRAHGGQFLLGAGIEISAAQHGGQLGLVHRAVAPDGHTDHPPPHGVEDHLERAVRGHIEELGQGGDGRGAGGGDFL